MRTPLLFRKSYNKLSRKERKLLEEGIPYVKEFVKKSKSISKVPYATRDAHAKSYAYLKGRFVPEPNSVFHHLFDQNSYEALARFSHAHLKIIKTDKQLPIYGLAVKMKSKSLDEINYPMVNFPVFITDSVSNFLKLFNDINQYFSRIGIRKIASLFRLFFRSFPIMAEMMNSSFFKATQIWFKTFSNFILDRNYHSIGAYRMDNCMVKLTLQPIELEFNSDKTKSIYENIESFLLTKPIRYQLIAQIAYDEKIQPINKLTQDWTNTEDVLIGEFQFDEIHNSTNQKLEEISFNPFDNPELFKPVGKIQAIREEIYKASIETRNELNKNLNL